MTEFLNCQTPAGIEALRQNRIALKAIERQTGFEFLGISNDEPSHIDGFIHDPAKGIIVGSYEVKTASYLAYLKALYEPHIQEYAKQRLEGQKTKTLTTPYGQISFRTVKGGLKVTDATLALDYAQLNGFTNAIKLSATFQISKLDPAQRELLEAKVPEGFEVVPDKEFMSIKVMG